MTPHATRSAALSATVSPEANLQEAVAPRDAYHDSTLDDLSLGRPWPSSRWMGWRLRLLVVFTLLGCLGAFALTSMVTVTLATHNRDNAQRFAELVSRLPEVQEAHALTGEMY